MLIRRTSAYRDAVMRGIAFLDINYPGWEQLPNAHLLDMSNPTWCLIGQLALAGVFGEKIHTYEGAIVALGIAPFKRGSQSDVYDLGFDTHGSFTLLQQEWALVLKRRRLAVPASPTMGRPEESRAA